MCRYASAGMVFGAAQGVAKATKQAAMELPGVLMKDPAVLVNVRATRRGRATFQAQLCGACVARECARSLAACQPWPPRCVLGLRQRVVSGCSTMAWTGCAGRGQVSVRGMRSLCL